MRNLAAIFCVIVATAAAAVTNPLGSDPANYTFTIPAFTNLLQGRLSGPGGDYRAMRMEDMDYLAEAAAERVAIKAEYVGYVTNRTAVIRPALSINPAAGGGSHLKAVDTVIQDIGLGESRPDYYTAYANETPVFPSPVVSAVQLTREEILAAADTPAHIFTRADMTMTRRPFPALADLTNRYALLDAIPCAISRDGGNLYTSNAIANHYHYESYTNGAMETAIDMAASQYSGGSVRQSAYWDWTREDSAPWVLDDSGTSAFIYIATNLAASASAVPGDFDGLAFALTSQPVRVQSPRAVVEWRVYRSDVTEAFRYYIDFTYSNAVESASYVTNYVYTTAPASVSLWYPGRVGMVATVTEADVTNVLAACNMRFPQITDASISHTPVPPGGLSESSRYDGFNRRRDITLDITPQVRFYLFETKFKTTIGGN